MGKLWPTRSIRSEGDGMFRDHKASLVYLELMALLLSWMQCDQSISASDSVKVKRNYGQFMISEDEKPF